MDGKFDTSGTPFVSGHLFEYVNTLQDKVFLDSEKGTIHQFAIAVGIASDRTVPYDQFQEAEGISKRNPGNQLATYDNIEAVLTLLELQGSLDSGKPNQVISEYLNGGLELLKEIEF